MVKKQKGGFITRRRRLINPGINPRYKRSIGSYLTPNVIRKYYKRKQKGGFFGTIFDKALPKKYQVKHQKGRFL